MHVDPATAKTTFAILQIIPPQIAEPIIKPWRQPPFCLRGIEVVTPLLQRFGVVQTEVFLILPRQASLFGKLPELAGPDEKTAGEYVGLNEVRAFRVVFEQVVAHRNVLDGRPATRFQIPRHAIYESGPVFTPKRFDHFDADDGVNGHNGGPVHEKAVAPGAAEKVCRYDELNDNNLSDCSAESADFEGLGLRGRWGGPWPRE